MNYFKTNMDVASCRSLLKSLKAHDYEFCIVALKNNTSIVISNCDKLTGKLLNQPEFENIGVKDKGVTEIHESNQYKTTHGNHGLLIDSLS